MATCRAPVSSIKSHNLSINHISIAWEHGTSSSSSSSSSASSSSLDSWRTRVAPGPWGVLALTASDDCTVSMWLVDVTKAGLGVDGSGNKDRDLALESGKGEGESSSSMAGRYGGSPMVHIRRFVFSSPIQRCFFDEKLRGGRGGRGGRVGSGGSGVESDSIIRDPSSSLHSLHCADRMVVGSWGSTLHVVECGIPNGLNMDIDTRKKVAVGGSRDRADAGVQMMVEALLTQPLSEPVNAPHDMVHHIPGFEAANGGRGGGGGGGREVSAVVSAVVLRFGLAVLGLDQPLTPYAPMQRGGRRGVGAEKGDDEGGGVKIRFKILS